MFATDEDPDPKGLIRKSKSRTDLKFPLRKVIRILKFFYIETDKLNSHALLKTLDLPKPSTESILITPNLFYHPIMRRSTFETVLPILQIHPYPSVITIDWPSEGHGNWVKKKRHPLYIKATRQRPRVWSNLGFTPLKAIPLDFRANYTSLFLPLCLCVGALGNPSTNLPTQITSSCLGGLGGGGEERERL